AAKQAGIQFIVGCRVVFTAHHDDEPQQYSLLVYPTDRASYGNLCRLLTLGKRRAPKGECHLTLHDLLDFHEGLLGVLLPPRDLDQAFLEVAHGLQRVFDQDRLSIAASVLYGEDDRTRLEQLA